MKLSRFTSVGIIAAFTFFFSALAQAAEASAPSATAAVSSTVAAPATPMSAPAPATQTSSAALTDKSAKERQRIEELFIWKASEELKLGAAEEAKFTTVIRSYNTRRRAANLKMDEALSALANAKTKPEAEKALVAHRAALRGIQMLQTGEVDQLKPLLGAQKLAQYLTVKNTILEKLKTLLSAPTPATGPQASATPENSSSTK